MDLGLFWGLERKRKGHISSDEGREGYERLGRLHDWKGGKEEELVGEINMVSRENNINNILLRAKSFIFIVLILITTLSLHKTISLENIYSNELSGRR